MASVSGHRRRPSRPRAAAVMRTAQAITAGALRSQDGPIQAATAYAAPANAAGTARSAWSRRLPRLAVSSKHR